MGEQLPGVAGVRRGQRLSPGQEEDHRQCPGSRTPLPPQGTLQSCAVHVSIQKRLPHFCTFAFLSLVFSLRDFRARRPSLLPAPCFPLRRPPSQPLRPDVGPSVWEWECASEKCFSQGSPTGFRRRRSAAGCLCATTISVLWHEEPGATV